MSKTEEKKIILAEPSKDETYSARPSRKPDISSRARLEGWHEEGVYLVTSVVQRPELKRERIIDQKNFKVLKTPGEKSSSLCLNMSVDSNAADPYGQMIDKADLAEGTMCMVTVRHLVRSWKKENGAEVFANKCLLLAIQ